MDLEQLIEQSNDTKQKCGLVNVYPHRPSKRKRRARANWQHKDDRIWPNNLKLLSKLYAMREGRLVKMKPYLIKVD